MLHLLISATILLAAGNTTTQSTFVSGAAIPSADGMYGGFSAIHIGEGGTSFLAVSDRDWFVTGQVTRKADGTIATISLNAPTAIEGFSPDGRRRSHDAEGLAVANDGQIFVSFEGTDRVGAFASLTSPEQMLPRHDDFADLPGNGGLEALAIDSTGTLFAIPEETDNPSAPFPVYRYSGGQWDVPYAIPRSDGFLIVGADFGPDGKLYVLERNFSGYSFFSRVRRIDLATQTAETILQSRFGMHGNMEGISVWKNAVGETIMTLIADNNFHPILTNEIAEYRVDG